MTDDDLLSAGTITSASSAGLAVMVNRQDAIRSWESITSVGAAIVHHGPARIFVLAIGFDDVRTFVISEFEPVWPQMVELLHVHLPGAEPFSSWAPKLIEKPGVVVLYERGM